jgi:hypothetical protein
MRYRVTYNVFHFTSDKRVSSKAQLIVEVEVKPGENPNDVAYGEASNLLPEKRFVIGGAIPLGLPVSVEKLRPKKVRKSHGAALLPDDDF